MEIGVLRNLEKTFGVEIGRDVPVGMFVGLVALAGSLSALQASGVVTPDATVVLACILVLAAVRLAMAWRSATLGRSTSPDGHAEPHVSSGIRSPAATQHDQVVDRDSALRPAEVGTTERDAGSTTRTRQRSVSQTVQPVLDFVHLAPPVVVARPTTARKAAKVDLFAGRLSEFIELRDARVPTRQ